MKRLVTLLGSCAVVFGASLSGSHVQDAPDPALPPATVELLDRVLRTTQVDWADSLPAVREALARDPRGVIEHLVEQLGVDEFVAGKPFESQTYNVCGNALTLLERLTDERVCGLGRDWIGFSTHDHRSAEPSREKIQGPWQAWLHVRADLPVDEWFWGLSYAEFRRLARLMKQAEGEWPDDALDDARALGRRAYPYLLDKLLDDEYALPETRYCDQANALLRALTGADCGAIERTQLLRLAAGDPDREFRLAIARNEASMALVQRRWMSALLAR